METDNRHRFSLGLFLVAQLIYLLGLATRPSPHRWLFFIPLASILCYLAFWTTTSNAVRNYGMGSYMFTLLFAASDFLVLTDVQRELKVLHGALKDRQIEDEPFLTRLKWALKLQTSPRGIGWSFAAHEPHIPPAPRPSVTRRSFIFAKAERMPDQ